MASAGYSGGKVFAASSDGRIYALNHDDGSLAWRFPNIDGHILSDFRTAPLLVEKNKHPQVNQDQLYLGSRQGIMYALSLDGQLEWRFCLATETIMSSGQPDSDCITTPIEDTAAYADGQIFFCAMNAFCYALDANTGNLNWKKPLPSGQGCRDRWTVAGNGKVFFTVNPQNFYHNTIRSTTNLFHWSSDSIPQGGPIIYNQPWNEAEIGDSHFTGDGTLLQRDAIRDFLNDYPLFRTLYIYNTNGTDAFADGKPAPVLHFSGGSSSTMGQPVLLPDGNSAYVNYRRSFGEPLGPADVGQTSHDKMYVGKLNLTTADIDVVEKCQFDPANPPPSGSGSNCGDFKVYHISDESTALMAAGDSIMVHTARRLDVLDTITKTKYRSIIGYDGQVGVNEKAAWTTTFDDYVLDHNNEPAWRINSMAYGGEGFVTSETSSDGNDLVRPAPIVGNTMYVLHYSTLLAIQGNIK